MTRDFNKPRRDGSNSSFRNSSPNRNRDERSPRPARPRLNRETVDRAWESGAQQQHADYHPRTGGGQARPQGQRNGSWNNTPNRQGYSSQDGRGSNRPYNNNRQENFRDNRSGNYRDDRDHRDTPRNFDRQSGFGNDYRPERPPYGQERRDFGGQHFENRRSSSNGPNRRDGDNRQQFQDRGNQRRDFGRNDRPVTRNTNGVGPQRESSHPRWQSRPGEQRNAARDQQREFNRRPNDGERFEGDYEHFEERNMHSTRSVDRFGGRDTRSQRPNSRPFESRGTRDARPPRSEGRTLEERATPDSRPPRPSERPFRGSRNTQGKPEQRFDDTSEAGAERHVTRLPDGRVLKGPRPVQRRNAQFWTGVTADTSELIDRVQEEKPDKQPHDEPTNDAIETPSVPASEVSEIPSAEESVVTNERSNEGTSEVPSTEESVSEVAPPKRRTRTASAVTRTKKPRSTGPKPSQRGFKWPTQE